MMKLVCSFSNVGSRNGVIEYLVARLQSDDGTKWLFAPYVIVDEARLFSDGCSKYTWPKGPFSPVVMPGKQTQTISILFFPGSGLPHLNDVTVSVHKFRVTILTWAAGESDWREQQKFTVNLDQNAINNISTGIIFGTPSVEQQEHVQRLQ